ncbi:epoxyqueuosine reductase [Candidatus Bathyarchaeota archaeon]|nr:epoxyqueuosine reductase [Candidatus Bathyarchaeota archaeon]
MLTSSMVKDEARRIGFNLVGIISIETLRTLPVGDVGGVKTLRLAEEEFPPTKSAIVLGYYLWDPIFNVHTIEPGWKGYGLHSSDEEFEFHQLYTEVIANKAWMLADWIRGLGFEAKPSAGIPLKRAAVEAGLGCQGKNTLLISTEYGPRVRLGAVLTSADLQPDIPFKEDLCRECMRCVLACPTKALKPYKIEIKRCMVYASESPESRDVDQDVRELTDRLTFKPTRGSFIECTICQEACPIGRKT